MPRPRVLIEDWLPARAIGVECMRENSTGLHPPPNRLHVWWARRPLTISRAAVLGSLLPADFDRATFERLLGFGRSGHDIVELRRIMDGGVRMGGFGFKRAFSAAVPEPALQSAHISVSNLWADAVVLDPMAGGGSIPLESARMGLTTLANEYNPVACSVEEVTLDYPFRFSSQLASVSRHWGAIWRERFLARVSAYFPAEEGAFPNGYIFARTVPCPDTGHPTPLVPDWSLSRASGKPHLVANPVVTDKESGRWTIEVRTVGKGAGELAQPPARTYARGKAWSLFTRTEIPSEYIKAMAQQGKLGSHLYAVAVKDTSLHFRPPEEADYRALAAAEAELARLRPAWERGGIIPTEEYPSVSSDPRPRLYGMPRWADMFSPRQLLAAGVIVEELKALRKEIVAAEGEELGEAVVHLLAISLDKFVEYNSVQAVWHAGRNVVAHTFSQHAFPFRASFSEVAASVSGAGLDWAIDNVLDAYEKLCALPRAPEVQPVVITQGSATSLPHLEDGSVTAVVVDPPYADNVQYSELADFFYVWLKRTQGHRRPEWFMSELSEHSQEAVVNISRHRNQHEPRRARAEAHRFYQRLMTDVFRESYRVLREDGVLTVMFTHKQQSAWADLFRALIKAGFTITATWPVKTESEHSLHQARKNAAQSTVLLVARKREQQGAIGYYDELMEDQIGRIARETAARLEEEGLNRVDQMVGAFGPAMTVFSRYDEVRTTTGRVVSVSEAIQAAADAVAEWRINRYAERHLDDVDAESRYVLLCWDVLQAEEFRFDDAMLLGRSLGMDVNSLVEAGLAGKTGANVSLLPARERRREKAVATVAEQMELFASGKGRRKAQRGVHPGDEFFGSAIDMAHALALRYLEAGGEQPGIGAARSMALQRHWDRESAVARLIAALVAAAPEAVRFPGKEGNKTAADRFPEFRAWHALLKPVFGIDAEEWVEPVELQRTLL